MTFPGYFNVRNSLEDSKSNLTVGIFCEKKYF